MTGTWKRIALGSDGLLLEIQPGYACGKKDVVGGVIHLRMNNITKDGALDMTLTRRIPLEVAEKHGRFAEQGDVMFVNTNSTELVGKSCIFDGWREPCAFSNHITKLRVNPDELHPLWLHLCFRRLWHEGYFATHCVEFVGQSSFGKDQLRSLEIPVPPLEEQRRLVARVEALTSRTQELRALNASLVEDVTGLLSAQYRRICRDAPTQAFGRVAKLARRRVDAQPDESYQETGIRSFGKGTFRKPALTGRQLGKKRVFRICSGDLVFMNVFAWEGAIAVATPEDEGHVASHRFMTHEVDSAHATAEFLCYHFLTEHGLERIRAASPGSAGRNRTLGITKLHAIPVPVPPVDAQRRFARLYGLRESLRTLQREAETDLSIFTPALLAKALGGEL